MRRKILIVNGPNLNMLGTREPDIYGHETLDNIAAQCRDRAGALALGIEFRQSNSEADMVDWIQQARGEYDGIIVNAGAYTHTSVALLDALLAAGLPAIEVHLSNIFRRETFRQESYIARAAEGVISGFGGDSYLLALEAMDRLLQNRSEA